MICNMSLQDIEDRIWFLKKEAPGYEIPDEKEDHNVSRELTQLYSERKRLRNIKTTAN